MRTFSDYFRELSKEEQLECLEYTFAKEQERKWDELTKQQQLLITQYVNN